MLGRRRRAWCVCWRGPWLPARGLWVCGHGGGACWDDGGALGVSAGEGRGCLPEVCGSVDMEAGHAGTTAARLVCLLERAVAACPRSVGLWTWRRGMLGRRRRAWCVCWRGPWLPARGLWVCGHGGGACWDDGGALGVSAGEGRGCLP